MIKACSEPAKTLNGIPLSIGQAMTLRCALESFGASLQDEDALGADEVGRGIRAGYLSRLNDLRRILTTTP